MRARSNQSSGKERATSTGLGRMVGEMMRSSAVPVVTKNHASRMRPMGMTP